MNSAMCSPFSASIHSYCDYGDNQCCSPYPDDGNAAHHNYVKKYNQDVVDFIKQRLTTAGPQDYAHTDRKVKQEFGQGSVNYRWFTILGLLLSRPQSSRLQNSFSPIKGFRSDLGLTINPWNRACRPFFSNKFGKECIDDIVEDGWISSVKYYLLFIELFQWITVLG